MPTKEENDLLTLTGPDTLGGAFMRRYWQPIALAEEVREPGSCIPIRVLAENLVLYRDLKGGLGLLGRWCSHRGTDLARGYVEEEGLRCVLHGWLYDARGRCLEQPLEPPEDNFCDEIHHPAYPCVERGGLVFGYLGPNEPPTLPAYECLDAAEDHRASAKYLIECNYLQSLEGNVDPAQLGLLMRLGLSGDSVPVDAIDGQLEVEPEGTEFGVRLLVLQSLQAEQPTLAVRNFIMPDLCLTPASGMDGGVAHWHVPIDDTHHWHYVLAFRRDAPITVEQAEQNGIELVEDYRLTTERPES